MRLLHVTALYTTILAALSLYNGCGSEPERDKEDKEKPAERRPSPDDPPRSGDPDPGPDDPERAPDVINVPTTVAAWPTPLLRIRDKVAEDHCVNNVAIKRALGDMNCRVAEQKRWLDNEFLYSDGGDSSEAACVTQLKRLEADVLKFESDSAGEGAKWLAKACKAATDKVMKDMRADTEYERNDDLPTENAVRDALRELLSDGDESSFQIEETSSEDETPSYNIEMMTRFSLYRLNHNCAQYMDTKQFPEKITAEETEGGVKAFYVFRQFRDQGDTVFQALYPVLDVYRGWSDTAIPETNIQKFGAGGGYIDFTSASETLPASAKIIAIRRIATTCDGGKRPYERHAKHAGSGDSSVRTTLFDLSPKFDVAFPGGTDGAKNQCKGTDSTLRRVIPAAEALSSITPPLKWTPIFVLAH